MLTSTSYRRPCCALFCVVFLTAVIAQSTVGTSHAARGSIADRIGMDKGICVILDDEAIDASVEIARQTECLVYMQLPDPKAVAAARQSVYDAGYLNSRIFIESGALSDIHLGGNIADVVIASDISNAPQSEVLRILRPGGKAFLGGKKLVKSVPAGIDDWTHPYHGPDNNPQSQDKVIRAPYLTQFLADPRYGPLPQVAVTSGGRLFKAFGHIAFKTREEPLLNTLVAFNAYNGTMLWKHKLSETYMIHRNTIIAAPDAVYVADDKSCKVLDAATGGVIDEIVAPTETTGGTFWKWMALEKGVLYAMVGAGEYTDPVIRAGMQNHGWPWNPLSPGFNAPEHPWGFGKCIVAVDPKTKKVLWSYREDKDIDSRAVCMKNGRMYLFGFGSFLTCLDADNGKVLWRKTPQEGAAVFTSLGKYLNRQDWRTNWRSTAYLKCTDDALYFAGPQIGKLLAVSTKDGRILWEHPYDNFQLVIRDDCLYGISGQIDNDHLSMKLEPLTGRIIEQIPVGRRACTRPTGSMDSVFFRASGGSVRLDTSVDRPYLISPMRAQCLDGVTIANGLLYWWPSVCDCNLTLYGITALGPAGGFDFTPKATETERLESTPASEAISQLDQTSADWCTFRGNNSCTALSQAKLPAKAELLWKSKTAKDVFLTAPVAAAGMVFAAGDDGVVRALRAADGKALWTAFTGGDIRVAPTVADGRVFVGSSDGWVYAFEARTGRQLWRFRAAPAQDKIPVYGKLLSRWPAASGVLVADGVAYVAAGIVNYDGTYVYALDAETGKVKWQNNTSGHLYEEAKTGVSVQGHMLLAGNTLALAGGNAVSPAIYDISDGRCLNDPSKVQNTTNNNVPASFSPRGSELYRIGGGVVACGKPLYAHPDYEVYDQTVFNKTLVTTQRDFDVVWANNTKLLCYPHVTDDPDRKFTAGWGKLNIPGLKSVWDYDCPQSRSVAVCTNAVVVVCKEKVAALNLADGKLMWEDSLPAEAVLWGTAIDRDGRVIVSCRDGQIACFGGPSRQ